MKHLISLAVAMLTALSVYAYRFDYQFNNTPLAQALVTIGSEHPDINLSFVYTELDNYRTSAQVHTDNAYDAVSEIVGLNPVSVIRKGNNIYVEALQHGKFCYMGRLIVAEDNEPVVAATVMLLAPVDSTVITFGITDNTGRFIIPCDRQEVIGKMSCIGYKTKYKDFSAFNVGDIVMTALPVALGTVTVESDYAQLYSDKSVYIPTSRQKNSSQSGIELINRMAIPQIRLNSSGDITTMAGKEVSIFIDFMPATEAELKGMRMSDVRRVEYYDYPSDPRFQYKSHVINFIMTQYEYGGYGKVYADENLFINSGQIMSYGRLQYKSMTYDIAVGGYYMNNSHIYTDTNEEFRLPQADGAISTIERNSITDDSKLKRHDYWVTGKALYKTDNITMSNTIATDFDHKPQNNSSGTVTYSPEAFESSTYLSRNNEKRNSLSYIGHWNFILSKSDVLVFNPTYSFSHTTANSRYEENRENAFINNASDNSHLMEANLSFTHKFDNGGALKTMLQSYYLNNNTHYSGNRTMDDHAETLRLGPGVSYSYNNEKFHSKTGIGLHYDRSSYGDFKESSATPWIDLSFQYAFNRKNSVNAGFKFVKSIPQPGYRSAVVIQSNPLMSYTGNPLLVPYKSFDCEMSYTLTLPHNIYATAYGYAWIVKDRYAYDYEASPTGILRTIKQPMV